VPRIGVCHLGRSAGLCGGLKRGEGGRRLEAEGAQDPQLRGGGLAGLVREAGVAAEGALVQALELAAHVAPRVAGLVLGDPDEQQRQPAELDVGADAVFLAVVERSEVEQVFMSRQPRSTCSSCL